jgi:hypothetical protein
MVLYVINNAESTALTEVMLVLSFINEALCLEDIFGNASIAPPLMTWALDQSE